MFANYFQCETNKRFISINFKISIIPIIASYVFRFMGIFRWVSASLKLKLSKISLLHRENNILEYSFWTQIIMQVCMI